MLLTWRSKNPLTVPLALVAAILLTHGVVTLFHLPEDTVRQSGLMFSMPANSHPVIPLITGEYFRADWTALLPVVGDLAMSRTSRQASCRTSRALDYTRHLPHCTELS